MALYGTVPPFLDPPIHHMGVSQGLVITRPGQSPHFLDTSTPIEAGGRCG